MTLDEFMQQDPKAKITITERASKQGLVAQLKGTLWHDARRGTGLNIVASGYAINTALASLDDQLNETLGQS